MAVLYTGMGDGGYTAVIGDGKISKADVLIDLIGTMDEASAALGLARACADDGKIKTDIQWLLRIFVPLMGAVAGGKIAADAELISELERKIDGYGTEFDGFSMPGENLVSAHLNMARCIVRRAERVAAALLHEGRISRETAVCLNRMSDLIYAMSRCAEK